jgi:hypothetical protein
MTSDCKVLFATDRGVASPPLLLVAIIVLFRRRLRGGLEIRNGGI